MYTYNDIQLSIVNNLRSSILNSLFNKLYSNDHENFPDYVYMPKIWENKWFNDNSIKGYDKGDCVWKYTMTDDGFLENYGDLVYQYCQDSSKPKLQTSILSTWTQVKSAPQDTKVKYKKRYLNAISGYSENGRQYYDQIFDYGIGTNNLSRTTIQIYISTKENNKAFLSDDTAWEPAVISSEQQYQKFIEKKLKLMLQQHVDDYHLGGVKTYQELDQIIVNTSLSNFNEKTVYNYINIDDHDAYTEQEGFSHVKQVVKKEVPYIINGKEYKTYKMFRAWGSGFLEHFGIISVELCDKSNTNYLSDYIQKVDLNWEYQQSDGTTKNAPVYDYPMTSSYYDQLYPDLNYDRDHIEYNAFDPQVDQTYCYNITLTPITFDPSTEIVNDPEYGDYVVSYDQLKNRSYPDKPLNNLNKTYFTPEIHHIKNSSFSFTKPNTDDLRKSEIKFYQYYVTGYSRVFEIQYNIANSTVIGLEDTYEYTGQPITPSFTLVSGKYTLQEGIDYTVNYENNTACGSATIRCVGKNSFNHVKEMNFQISKFIETTTIEGFEQYYELI